MTRQTNADRILQLLARSPGLDDDRISDLAGIRPRQQVNQICRRLEAMGLLRRVHGPDGKIVNHLTAGEGVAGARGIPGPSPLTKAAPPGSAIRMRASEAHRHEGGPAARPLPATDSVTTLFVLPCSASKRSGAGSPAPAHARDSILGHLPAELGQRLQAARHSLRAQAAIDETTLMPAWRRYTGTLYRAAGHALEHAVMRDRHVVILSGGYGVVLAREPIGTYEARFRPSLWPKGLLEAVLLAYAERHGLRSVRAVASATTSYRRLIEAVPWRRAGIADAVLLTPEPAPGAMVKAPRAAGEALAALLVD